MARPRTGDKDQTLIQAAVELFLEKGVRGTTIQQIAKKADVAVGTVYVYHKDKTSIIRRVAYGFADQHHVFAEKVIASRRQPTAKLKAYLLGLYDMWQPFGENKQGPIELADAIITHAPETLTIAQKEFHSTVSQILSEAKQAGLRVQNPKKEATWISLCTSAFFPLAGTPSARPLTQSLTRKELAGMLDWINSKLS